MEKLAKSIIEAIDDKKGKDIVTLDLRGFDGAICDMFVVCNADSTTQVGAICDGVEEKVHKDCEEWPVRIQGKENALWIVMDYGNIMVHIFQTEMRDYYRLEDLWADANLTHY